MKKLELKAITDTLPSLAITNIKNVVDNATEQIIDQKLLHFDGDTPFILHQGRYVQLTPKEAKTCIRQALPRHIRSKVSSSQINEIFERCLDCLDLQIDMDANYLRGEYVVNTLDGLYDIKAQRIVEQVGGYIPDYVLDFRYRPRSKISHAPNFEKFINMSSGMQQLTILLQVIGSCLSSLQRCRAIFFLIGEGGTGKSTLLDVIESIFPEGMIAHEPLHHIGTEQAKAHYRGKRLNIGRDTKRGIIGNEESIKNLASNEWTTSRELYQCSVDYIPRLKFIYASNHFPQFANPDDALFDRMVIITFPNKLPPESKDPDFKEKLLAERDVIFSLALDSLSELISHNYRYDMGDLAKEKLAHQRLLLHNVEEFASEMLEFTAEGRISSKALVSSYEDWCLENQIPPLAKEELFDHLTTAHPEVKRSKVGPSDHRRCGFKGIQIRSAHATDVSNTSTAKEG